MLNFEDFAQQDFYTTANHISQFEHVESQLIFGEPSYQTISIVIPTYKRAYLLKEALESCLLQTKKDFNIVIADNNPVRDDETELLIRTMPDRRIVYYKNEENMGPLANFNRCIELADCDFCVFLCSDDLLDINFLKSVQQMIDKHPSADMLLPQKDIIYSHKTRKMKGYNIVLRMFAKFLRNPVAVRLTPRDFMLFYQAGGPSGIVYRKDAFLELGGFNPEWHPTGDNILHIHFTAMKEVYLVSVDSGDYRMLDNISLENGMSNIYLIQNYLFRKKFISKYNKYTWADNFYKGYVYYRLKVDRTGFFSVSDIRKAIGKCNVFHYLFFVSVWVFHYIKLPFRIRRW
jgi:glycosyltransferase involved in cell wall biosynthesis